MTTGTNFQEISASEALDAAAKGEFALVDVRSPGEFAEASVPGFINLPILLDQERHEVGIAYKKQGQAAAVKLGHRLVEPDRERRIEAWYRHALSFPNSFPKMPCIVTCWRGGLRSQLACSEIRNRGLNALQVRGGYKSMRAELLGILGRPHSLLVLAGMTGSGKTAIIQELPIANKIDLERLAQHRGSSFGRLPGGTQPSIATFENRLALGLRDLAGSVLIEDESRGIGNVNIPLDFLKIMQRSPIVVVTATLEGRAQQIFREYIQGPIQAGYTQELLSNEACLGVNNIRKKLGGALSDQLIAVIRLAFSGPEVSEDQHIAWISVLLKDYYDKLYAHSVARWQRTVIFEGDRDACFQWILHQFDSRKP